MALITRVSRLFQADFHAVLDRIEEPELLLRQAVREMEEEMALDEQRSKLLQHEQHLLGNREAELKQSLHGIEEELGICFEADNDDLARTLIKRKLEAQRFGKNISRKRGVLKVTLDELSTRIRENHSRLESMQQKAEILAEESACVRSADNWAIPETTVSNEDVEVAFMREKQSRSQS